MNLAQLHPGFFDFDYIRRKSEKAAGLTDAQLTHALLDPRNVQPFNPNCLFDVDYFAQNSTEAEARDSPNPIVRYLTKGAGDDAWPNPFFDPLFFRRNAGSAARQHTTLIEHALAHLDGRLAAFHPFIDVAFICQTQGLTAARPFYEDLFGGELDIRQPHPLFDVDYIREHGTPDIANMRDAFHWYWQQGHDVATHVLFDVAYYQSQFEPEGSVLHSVYHYLISAQPVSPQPLLDPAYYRAGAIAAGARPVARALEDFIVNGQAMGIDPSPYFDVKFYRDQSHCGQDALQHYVAGGHKRFSPHPLINAVEDRLLSRTSRHAEHSAGARLVRWPEDVPMSLTPDVDPVFLGNKSKGAAAHWTDLRHQYFQNDYPDGRRPNGVFSASYVAALLSALFSVLGEAEDASLQTYFRKALHQRKRLLVALENLDDTAANRVWLDLMRSQLANPKVEFIVVGARGGALLSAFSCAAHLWVLSGQSTTVAPLDTLRRSAERLAEVVASNPPVATFVEVDGSIVVTEALAALCCPTIAFGGAGLARRRPDEVHRLAVLADHILCASAPIQSRLQSHFQPGDGPATSVFGPSLSVLPVAGRPGKRPQDLRQTLGLPDDAILVVGNGPLDLENSVDLFGVVAAKCLSHVDCPANAYFVWHGSGLKFPNTPAFYASYFVHSAADPDRFRIISEPDLNELLAAADIFLKFCRDSADMSGVAAARAAGVPVVVSNAQRESEDTADLDGMMVVDAFDPDAACDVLLQLFKTPQERERLGRSGPLDAQYGLGLSGFIERMNSVLANNGTDLQLRPDPGFAPKDAVLIVASKKMAGVFLADPGKEDAYKGETIKHFYPKQIAAGTLPVQLQDHISDISCDEIVWCTGSEGLNREFISEFSHAIWVAEGLTSQLREFYRLGLEFEKIFVSNGKIIGEMTNLNPTIAAIMSVLDESIA